jgi:Helicase subunit of the DNA excision repair complex
MMPPSVTTLIEQGQPQVLDALLKNITAQNPSVRWSLTNGMWTYGSSSLLDFLGKLKKYTLKEVVEQISCPTLVLAAEEDQFLRGQPEALYEHLTCPKTFIRFTAEEGAKSIAT